MRKEPIYNGLCILFYIICLDFAEACAEVACELGLNRPPIVVVKMKIFSQ